MHVANSRRPLTSESVSSATRREPRLMHVANSRRPLTSESVSSATRREPRQTVGPGGCALPLEKSSQAECHGLTPNVQGISMRYDAACAVMNPCSSSPQEVRMFRCHVCGSARLEGPWLFPLAHYDTDGNTESYADTHARPRRLCRATLLAGLIPMACEWPSPVRWVHIRPSRRLRQPAAKQQSFIYFGRFVVLTTGSSIPDVSDYPCYSWVGPKTAPEKQATPVE